jgi:hypothetical protein
MTGIPTNRVNVVRPSTPTAFAGSSSAAASASSSVKTHNDATGETGDMSVFSGKRLQIGLKKLKEILTK